MYCKVACKTPAHNSSKVGNRLALGFEHTAGEYLHFLQQFCVSARLQEPRKGYNAAVAEGNQPTVTVSSNAKREAAEQMLHNVLNSWTISKTAKAAHPSMLPQDQQKILDWLFAHKQVTINKFTKVSCLLASQQDLLCPLHLSPHAIHTSEAPWAALTF